MSAEHLNFDVVRPPAVNPSGVLIELIGRFKIFQFMVFLLACSPKLATAMNMLGVSYWAPHKQYHTCPPAEDAKHCPCDNPVFGSEYAPTIISQFKLVCDRAWYKTLAQSIFQLGVLLGSYLFGYISDRWGRRKSLIIASVIQMVSSITTAAATHIIVFEVHRFIIGVSTGGAIVIAFVILNEFLHPKDRDVVAPCFFLAFNFSAALTAPIAYFFRDWRYYQIASGVASFLMLPMFCLLPDSPRWLLCEGKTEKAIETIERCRRWNNMPTEMVRPGVMQIHGLSEKGMTVKAKHLITNALIRRYFFIMCWNWCVSSMAFYGISQFVGSYAGDLYLNTGFNQGMNFLGCSFGVPITVLTRRQPQMIFMLFVSGVSIIITNFIPSGFFQVALATVTSICGFLAFNLCFIYGSELYPTVIRSRALGLNSVCARFGSMIAPIIVDFVPNKVVPFAFGLPLIIGAILAMFLDETKGSELPNTLEDLEIRRAKLKETKSFWNIFKKKQTATQ